MFRPFFRKSKKVVSFLSGQSLVHNVVLRIFSGLFLAIKVSRKKKEIDTRCVLTCSIKLWARVFFLFRKESFHSSLPCHEKFSPLKKWPIDHQWIEQNFRQMRSEVYIVIVNVRTLYLTIAQWGRYLYEITINYRKVVSSRSV